MKRTLLSILVATSMTTAAFAGDMETDNKWEKGAKDAWIDGKAEATLLFNPAIVTNCAALVAVKVFKVVFEVVNESTCEVKSLIVDN